MDNEPNFSKITGKFAKGEAVLIPYEEGPGQLYDNKGTIIGVGVRPHFNMGKGYKVKVMEKMSFKSNRAFPHILILAENEIKKLR
jgi:hypothetical protein